MHGASLFNLLKVFDEIKSSNKLHFAIFLPACTEEEIISSMVYLVTGVIFVCEINMILIYLKRLCTDFTWGIHGTVSSSGN